MGFSLGSPGSAEMISGVVNVSFEAVRRLGGLTCYICLFHGLLYYSGLLGISVGGDTNIHFNSSYPAFWSDDKPIELITHIQIPTRN